MPPLPLRSDFNLNWKAWLKQLESGKEQSGNGELRQQHPVDCGGKFCLEFGLDLLEVGLEGGQIGLGRDGIVESLGHGGNDGFGLPGFDAGILKLAGGFQSVENSGGRSFPSLVISR